MKVENLNVPDAPVWVHECFVEYIIFWTWYKYGPTNEAEYAVQQVTIILPEECANLLYITYGTRQTWSIAYTTCIVKHCQEWVAAIEAGALAVAASLQPVKAGSKRQIIVSV